MAGKKTYTGADLKAFMNDTSFWNNGGKGGQGYYLEDDLYTINGEQIDSEKSFDTYGENFEKLPDDAKVKVEGYLCENAMRVGDGLDLATTFRKWVDANSKHRLIATFELDKNLEPAERQKLLDTLTSLGAKLSGSALESEAAVKATRKPKLG